MLLVDVMSLSISAITRCCAAVKGKGKCVTKSLLHLPARLKRYTLFDTSTTFSRCETGDQVYSTAYDPVVFISLGDQIQQVINGKKPLLMPKVPLSEDQRHG